MGRNRKRRELLPQLAPHRLPLLGTAATRTTTATAVTTAVTTT